MRVFYSVICTLCVIFLCSTGAFAVEKDAIKKNVDSIVNGINKGESADSFKANDYTPYVFIMKKNGVLVVHPSLAGESLKKKAWPFRFCLLNFSHSHLIKNYALPNFVLQ